MTGLPFEQGAELRQRLHRSDTGDHIVLEAGVEYQGPFILDKPTTLIGQGDTTVLFAKGKPAIVVLSLGVRLEHLELADAYDPHHGTCLLVERSAQPTLAQVKTNGQGETVSQEQVINFGEILAGHTTSTFIELNVAEPASVECAPNSADWLRLQLISSGQADTAPEKTIQLPAAGRYMVRLICIGETFLAGDIALGQIHIASQKNPRTLWAYAHVVPAYTTQPLEGNLILTTDKKRHIRVNDSFLIGRDKFPGLSNGDSLAEQQAFILRDNNQAWAIFQPWVNETSTQVNGKTMGFGQRVWLSQGDVIEAGRVRLKVASTSDEGQYSADKLDIDLGSTAKLAAEPCFHLTYQGHKNDRVTLNSHLDWIQLQPTTIDVQAGDIHKIMISLSPAAKNLLPKKYIEPEAILISGAQESLAVDISFEVKPAPESLVARFRAEFMSLLGQTTFEHFRTGLGMVGILLGQRFKQAIAELPDTSRSVIRQADKLWHQITEDGFGAGQSIVRVIGQLRSEGFRHVLLLSRSSIFKSCREILHRTSLILTAHRNVFFAAFVLIILVGLILTGNSLQKGRQQEQAYRQLIVAAQRKFEQALAVDASAALIVIAEAEAALNQAEQIKANELEVATLRQQITARIDQLTNVQRLTTLQQVHHYTDAGTDMASLIVQGHAIYALDTGNSQVFHHQLNQTGDALLPDTDADVLSLQGQARDPLQVNPLLAMTELPPGGNHQTYDLAILDQRGLLTYRPDQGITASALAQAELLNSPVAIAGYFGNFYLLHPQQNTLLRYLPQVDGYSQLPEPYFPVGRDVDLTQAIDIAIDGAVYILYRGGQIEKYWGAEPVDFSLTGIDKPLDNPVAIFTGPDEVLQYVYIVDQGNQRIVQVQKDGRFVRQFKPDFGEADVFAHLQDIFVDEIGDRIFLLDNNKLYIGRLG